MYTLVIAFAIFGFVFFTILGLLGGGNGNSPQERIQLALGRAEVEHREELPPLKERIITPITKIIKKNKVGSKELNPNEETGELKILQILLGLLLGLFFFALYSILQTDSSTRLIIFLLGFVLGHRLPQIWHRAQIKKKQTEIEKTLPDTLDLLTVSVEAGLGFDSALLKVVEKQKGALAEEFLRVLQEIKMGRPRRDALRDLGKRNPISDLNNVIAALVQADQLGIPIAGVLRNQSKQIRLKHCQRAEEKAQKAPVKMMIPLVFFIFPSIFIVILGPAAIRIMETFGN